MTTTNNDKNFELKGELVETHYYHRFPCYTCGGTTEKYAVRCDVHVPVPPAEPKPFNFTVCETCLQSGNIDQRLADYATHLDHYAESVREMIGHLKLPAYAEWQARCNEVEERNERAREAWERERPARVVQQRGFTDMTDEYWFRAEEEAPF